MNRAWKFIATSAAVCALVLVGGVILAQTELAINLDPQNNSGESGTATLTDMGNNQVQVVVSIQNAPAGVPQPMHVHKGTCANLDAAPAYPLTNLVDGKSTTVISTTLADLLASPFAINGHKSADEANVYVFCGNISAAMQGTTPGATDAMTATTAAATTPTAEVTVQATTAATEAATMAATEAPTEAATAAADMTATPGAQATTTPALPTTGGTPTDTFIPILLVGVLVLILGLTVRRIAR